MALTRRRGGAIAVVAAVLTFGALGPAHANYPIPDDKLAEATEALSNETAPADCPTGPAPGGTVPNGMDYRQLCLDAVRLAPTFEAERAIKYAFGKLGTPYSQGVPERNTTHFDCSSFIGRMYTAANAPVRLQNGSLSAFYPSLLGWTGRYVPSVIGGSNLQRLPVTGVIPRAELDTKLIPGDIIILFNGNDPSNSAGNAGHAQLYLGNGYIIHAGGNVNGGSNVNVRKRYNSSLQNEWYFRYNTIGQAKRTDVRLPANTVTKVRVGRPEETVVGNLTVVTPVVAGTGWGYTSAYPCDAEERPTASVNNYQNNQNTPNLTAIKTDENGDICLYGTASMHVVWDQVHNGKTIDGQEPERLLDTRSNPNDLSQGRVPAGGRVVVDTGRRNSTVLANLTVVAPTAPGFTTVYPCNTAPPLASTNNYETGEITPNFVMARTDNQGRVCITTMSPTHLLWDQLGEASDVRTTAPQRLFDSREDNWGHRVGPGQRVVISAGRPGETVVGNLTVTDPINPGYTVAYPCSEGRPNASVNNFKAGETTPNGAMVRTDDEGYICLETSEWTHLIWDQVTSTDELSTYNARRLKDTRVAGQDMP